MDKLLLIVIVYFAYLFIWFVINVLTYFVSLIFKKPTIMSGLSALSTGVVYILNTIIGLWLLWVAYSSLFSGKILLFLFLIFLGIGLISTLFSILQLPFILIPAYLAEKIDNLNLVEEITTVELLDENNNVIDKIEGDTTVSMRFAKYFLAFFSLNFFTLIIFPAEREALTFFGYLTKPFIQIITVTLLFGIPYAIYRRVRYKSFFPDDKRLFFIKVWKLSLWVFIPLIAMTYLLALATGTL